jgi:predicted TPR repeat methyltransferase
MEKIIEMKDTLEKFGEFKAENIDSHYDDLAGKYDEMLLAMGHVDPGLCASLVAKYCAVDCKVIDFGCGTGMVGEELVGRGITKADNIVGIDAS